MRSGVVTKKLGMSIFFDEQGQTIPVTLLKLDNCQVVGHRNQEKDKVTAVRVGYGKIKSNKVSKPLKGYFLKHKLDFKRNVADFKVSQTALLDIGTYINADHYVVGQFVDVVGVSTGKGFAGVMKRHNFSGLRASHGVSISHRAHGSTGHCQDPGKVFKGKKMAGQMGSKRVTVSNLEIIQVDKENNILVVKGAVPGFNDSYVLVRDAKKRGLPADVPYPGVKTITEEKVNEDTAKADAGEGKLDSKDGDSTLEKDAKTQEDSKKNEVQVKVDEKLPTDEKKALNKEQTESSKEKTDEPNKKLEK
ncbi:MAG: 50S ribosomal protein L3 [Rickettsiales bacterium]|nr:50S ribosomal protein L3 [Rickettsiales bacterium]